MKIDIDRIKVDETSRIRQDIGNLSELQESINDVGLINPVLIDEQDRLIAGYRRLSACKNLDWEEIEVNVVELEDDELKMLEAEAAENLFRKDFTPEEILAIQKRREEIAEARRPKGKFERFWTWLKSLFAPKPEQVSPPVVQESPPEHDDSPEDAVKAEETDDQNDQSVQPDESGPPSDPEPEESGSIQKQPSSAEIVEENGMRHIKWR